MKPQQQLFLLFDTPCTNNKDSGLTHSSTAVCYSRIKDCLHERNQLFLFACRKCQLDFPPHKLHRTISVFYFFVHKNEFTSGCSEHLSLAGFNKSKVVTCCLLVHDKVLMSLFLGLLIPVFQDPSQRLGVLSSADSTASSPTSD